MAKIMIGVFVAVFLGALAYEILNRTKPEITEKLEGKISNGLDHLLTPAESKA